MECPRCKSDDTFLMDDRDEYVCRSCGNNFHYDRLIPEAELEAAIDRQLKQPWGFGDR